MKKMTRLVALLALGCLLLTGCAEKSEPFETMRDTPDAPVTELRLDVTDRSIEVTPSEDGQLHIQYAQSSKEFYDITLTDGVLTMTSASSKAWTDYIGTKPAAEDRRILLQIPDALLEQLTLSTTNEDITLCALRVTGGIRIDANGGDIAFEAVDVGSALALSAKNGDIKGTVVGSYDDFTITSAIKKGESNLPAQLGSGKKTLRVSCNNGDIDVTLTGGVR